jgi:hypothetical protein
MKTMRTMKKIVCIGMCVAMLTGVALAEGTVNAGMQPAAISQNQQGQQGQPPAMPSGQQNGNQQNGQQPQMPGMNGRNQQGQQGQPPAMPSGELNGDPQNGQPLQMPDMNGQNQQGQQGQPPAMPSGQQNGNQQQGLPPQMPGMNSQDQQGQPPELPENGDEAENAGTAVVQTGNRDPLRMRQKPSTKGRIMDQLSNGTEVEIIEVQEDWVKVRVNGKEGYVMIQYLDDVSQEQQEDAGE